MSFNTSQVLWTNRYKDLTLDNTAEILKSATNTFFGGTFNNTANSVAVYVKVYNQTSVTVGTTLPDFIFKIPAGATRDVTVNLGHGMTLGTGLGVACVTAGGTDGTTSPTNAVIGTVYTN